MDKFTKVIINWYDQGLRMPGPNDHIRTTINLEKRRISVAHVRPNGTYFYKTEVAAEEEALNNLFEAFRQIDWKSDYSVAVCDGFEWDMTLKGAGETVLKTHGTIDSPEGSKELEEMIYEMINDSGSSDFPMLFGNLNMYMDEDL